MKNIHQRDEFTNKTKEILAKRAGLQCSICQALTTGPNSKSNDSLINIGVAAHITSASPKGPRYDSRLTAELRSHISNGIWLCQNDAKFIDNDCNKWTASKLNEIKKLHEEFVRKNIGIAKRLKSQAIKFFDGHQSRQITPKEYAFVTVRELTESYIKIIAPILIDKNLNSNSRLGILMCGTELRKSRRKNDSPPWTVFVNEDWLRWILEGQSSGFRLDQEIPKEQIYGIIPGWPDTFFDFLSAIVQTNTPFEYKRQKGGYLVLAQSQRQNNKLQKQEKLLSTK